MRAQNSKASGASTLVLDQQLQCVQCLQMKTKFSQTVFCFFCGQSACKDCGGKDIKKQRCFPKSHAKERGKICRICDSKFLLRHTYMPQKVELAQIQ